MMPWKGLVLKINKTEFQHYKTMIYGNGLAKVRITWNSNYMIDWFIHKLWSERDERNFWKYVKNGKLDWSFHFLFLIFHLYKHFMINGVGLRQFMVIAVLTKENKELNWLWIVEKLKDLKMWEFAKRVFALNESWFGIVPPLEFQLLKRSFFWRQRNKYWIMVFWIW